MQYKWSDRALISCLKRCLLNLRRSRQHDFGQRRRDTVPAGHAVGPARRGKHAPSPRQHETALAVNGRPLTELIGLALIECLLRARAGQRIFGDRIPIRPLS